VPAIPAPDMNEKLAGPLGDFAPAQIRAELHRMADWIADYRIGIAERAVSNDVEAGSIAASLRAVAWEEPAGMDRIMADLDDVVMPGILHWGHPAFLGYFGSTSNTPALLGEMAAAALNVSAMTWKSSPAATEMENVVLDWIRDMTGLPPGYMGVVYDTASVAVMHALAAARESACGGTRTEGMLGRPDLAPLRIYASDQAHSSVGKAAIVLGVGEMNVVRVQTDDEFRMDCNALERAIERDVAQGLTPMAVIATVGTTSTGSVDPVAEIGRICGERKIWLHVDAAYGGAFGVLPEGRWVTEGMDVADSIVVNPHKWLFVPLDFSALYLRNPQSMRDLFSLTPEYLRGAASDSSAPDYMDYGIQLGRRFRALKAWMVFRAFGRAGIESRVRENCRLAATLANLVSQEPGFALATPVNMAIVCIRYQPAGIDSETANMRNQQIVERVNATGQAYLTYTTLRGETVIRAGFGNILTTDAHVNAVWNLIRAEARRM